MKSLQTIGTGSPVSLLLLLLLMGAHIDGYKPVILVHGVFEGTSHFNTLTEYIKKVHPETEVYAISLFNDLNSLTPMWKQVRGFRDKIRPIMQKYPDGVHLLCYSQGGLICRGLLYKTPRHNVDTFISLSSPQAGQYGDTEFVNWLLPDSMKTTVFRFCYNMLGQRHSICDYWNDPHHRSSYRQHSTFLAPMNGDRPDEHMKAWKKNFLRIKKLVLIGGPDDGVITPWQSSLFGFFDSKENVVEMKDQKYYKKDLFGLKTLDARGDISTCVRSGVEHLLWHSNFTVFSDCIEKWLT